MTFKDKLILVLLTIITLGIYLIVIYKKKPKSTANELSIADKVTVDLDKLKSLLGEGNIAGSEYTHTKVKIWFHDKSKVNVEEIQKLKGISGVFATTKYITIIVGNQAKKIATAL